VTTATRVYLARLSGIAVFDPNGDPVGRVRDAVVTLRAEAQAPRVLGLVVEIQQRRRIFVPIGRITSVDVDAVVLATGQVSLKRYEQRPGELLVLGELLDRRVIITETGRAAILIDAAMEQTPARDWVLTTLAVRELTNNRLSRRRGQVHQLAWDQVAGLRLPEGEQGAANLLAVFDKMRPADLAGVFKDLSAKRRHEVAQALDDDRLADVLEELPEEDQIQILASLTGERAADVLEAMDPDDAADLLHELPAGEQERLLKLMQPEEAAPVRRLLRYSEDTAGGLMTSEPVVLLPDATVAEALARIRDPRLTPALAAQVYVCRPPMDTPTGKYLGMAHIQRLLREPPSNLIGGVIDDDIDPLETDTSLHDVASYLATYNLVAVPVVDDSRRLVGAVTVDDVLDHLLPANWREGSHG